MENYILQAQNVTKKYIGHTALDDVSIAIPRGSVYGLLGPNGAGKTTMIRVINRITMPDAGDVLLNGHSITAEDIRKIGYMPEERGLYKKMKVGEQAVYFARLRGMTRHDAVQELKRWFIKFGIESWWNKRIEDLSKGMAQKVQFIVTVVHKPELLIFDEPFSGFDPVNANLLKNEILTLRDEGATIIFSTHNMSSVEEVCDHITLINKAKNILSGDVNQIRHQHGTNMFAVEFRGDKQALRTALQESCSVLDDPNQESIYESLKINIERNEDIKRIINQINESFELRSFREIIPSMNDIFIKAVSK